jgi:hypothetical protein
MNGGGVAFGKLRALGVSIHEVNVSVAVGETKIEGGAMGIALIEGSKPFARESVINIGSE